MVVYVFLFLLLFCRMGREPHSSSMTRRQRCRGNGGRVGGGGLTRTHIVSCLLLFSGTSRYFKHRPVSCMPTIKRHFRLSRVYSSTYGLYCGTSVSLSLSFLLSLSSAGLVSTRRNTRCCLPYTIATIRCSSSMTSWQM